MVIKAIDFTKKSLAEFQKTAKFGTEAKSVNDKRLRCWNRKKGVALGYEIHDRGKVKRGVIGLYGDISLTEYKLIVAQMIAETQLSRFRPTAITFEQYFETSFIEYSKRNHKSQKSVQCNYNRLSSVIKDKNLDQIKRGDIESELNRLSDRGLSNASVNRVLSLIKRLLNLALADELISSSGAKYIKKLKEKFKPSISLRDDVFRRYVALTFKAENKVHAMALALASSTGCRIGEITSIRLEDVSDNRSNFLIRDSKNGESRLVYVGKTGSKAIMAAMELSFNEFLFSSDRSSTGFIGSPRETHARIVKQLNTEFGTKNKFNIKDLRSTVGTKLYERSGDIKAVQEQLGHKTIDLTAKRYVHPSRENQMKRVNTIDEFFQ